MNKKKFLSRLRRALRGCGGMEIQSRLAFYSEMIDDRVEEGLSEEDAVNDIGDPGKIAQEIRAELNERPMKEKRPLSAGAKTLIVLGSPVWLSLLIAAAAVVFSLAVSAFAVVFSVIACVFAVLVSLYVSAFALGVSSAACLVCAIACVFLGSFPEALFALGACFICLSFCIGLCLVCAPSGKRLWRVIMAMWKRLCSMTSKRRMPV